MRHVTRAYLVITMLTLGGVFGYCATVDTWNVKAVFTALALLATNLANGMTRTPADAEAMAAIEAKPPADDDGKHQDGAA